jgi:hypothetical protein
MHIYINKLHCLFILMWLRSEREMLGMTFDIQSVESVHHCDWKQLEVINVGKIMNCMWAYPNPKFYHKVNNLF